MYDEDYKPNPQFVEAIAAILVSLMVPSEGYDEEAGAALDRVIDTSVCRNLGEEQSANIISRVFKAHRAGKTTEAELEAHAKALPLHLRETLLAKYALYLADVSDGALTEQRLERLQGLGEVLAIPSQQSRKIVEVAQIAFTKII